MNPYSHVHDLDYLSKVDIKNVDQMEEVKKALVRSLVQFTNIVIRNVESNTKKQQLTEMVTNLPFSENINVSEYLKKLEEIFGGQIVMNPDVLKKLHIMSLKIKLHKRYIDSLIPEPEISFEDLLAQMKRDAKKDKSPKKKKSKSVKKRSRKRSRKVTKSKSIKQRKRRS